MPRPKDERLIRLPEEDDASDNRRTGRFLGWLTASFLICLAVAAGLNLWLNPWGNYGRSGYFSVYNDRLAKIEYLKARPKQDLPRTLIIGSSVAMSLKPEVIKKRYGSAAFNLGTFWSTVDEAWCWLQFFRKDLGATPQRIVLCLETRSFSSPLNGPVLFADKRRRLLNAFDLAKHLPGYTTFNHLISKAVDALSWQQLKIGLATANKRPRRIFRPMEKGGFLSDGTSRTYSNEKPKPKFPARVDVFYRDVVAGLALPGTPGTEARRRELLAEKIIHPEVVARYFPGPDFARDKLELFERFLELCQAESIELILVINPVHPYFFDQLVLYTPHLARLRRLTRLIHQAGIKYPVIKEIINGHRVESFKGDPRRFYDKLHPTPVNWELVLSNAPRSSRK